MFPFLIMTLTVHTIPGTSKHLIMTGKTSNDVHRQICYANNIIVRTIDECNEQNAQEPVDAPKNGKNDIFLTTSDCKVDEIESLLNTLHCFVVDTDSTLFCIDLGANRVILKDIELFSSFTNHAGSVKGIGRMSVTTTISGTTSIKLKADNSSIDELSVNNAVCVPSSPYNLIPLQLLIKTLKSLGFQCKMSKHNN